MTTIDNRERAYTHKYENYSLNYKPINQHERLSRIDRRNTRALALQGNLL